MKDIHMNSIRTIDRAIDVLQAFSAKSTALTIEEISKISNIPKNTVYRILYTFERRGLVQFDADALTYHPGLRLLEFSMLKSSTLDVRQEAEPFLEELHSLTNETVLMALPEENEIFYVFKKENENHEGLKVNTLVGVRRPYLYGVLGQAILAFLPEKQIERVLSIPPQPHTQHTVTDAARIRERLKQIKRERVFVQSNETSLGVTGISAPVFDMNGNVAAAIAIVGPEVHLHDQLEAMRNLVIETSNKISSKMGCSMTETIR
ncbi:MULTISPECIES: IclR family transcriptional regulator [Paenibacillus]|uniref:Helix-turn-helix domain-containing protein n=1 Tax=Paenibacillus validus TaxID=44253 RepID=A0A7X2Z7X7_9BACL|nr:IclR family transcriptional regulator [Paenibacillus validus]MUG69936.1 helix-turn-helix domain-containing protein [Paenibacillus validus]